MMAALARGALQGEASVTAIVTADIVDDEMDTPDSRITYVHVATIGERKARMMSLGDAFLVLPGGIGTLDELSTVLVYAHLAQSQRPIVLLDADGFWESLWDLFSRMADHGFARPDLMHLVRSTQTISEALLSLKQPAVPTLKNVLDEAAPSRP
jgi:uncharacterized protein (TIGR00730 family)